MARVSKFTQTVYYRSPPSIKNLMSSLSGLRKRQQRYGPDFEESLSFLVRSQQWTNERLKEYQEGAVAAFVTSTIQQIPYYRERPEYGDFLQHRTVSTLPLLTKDVVRDNAASLQSPKLTSLPHTWVHTSGTTGTSLQFPISMKCFQREYAFRALHYSWGNVSLNKRDKIAICAGHPVAFHDRRKPPYWVYDRANNWLFLSSYHLSQRNLEDYVREIERFRPVMLGGYPSSLYLLALAHKKYGTGHLQLKSLFTGSETLFDHQRRTIEDSFGAKVFNWYGNTERCANVVECEKGELHLKLEHSYVEILNKKDQACKPGERGRLVCTGFGNEAFPLIRYEVGDWVTVSNAQQSQCGKGGLLIDRIEGRTEDYVLTPDGRMVGRLDHLFKDSTNVVQAQIFQDNVNEIVLRIIKNRNYSSDDEKLILDEAKVRLGSDIRVRFEYVDHIERTKGGKLRFVVSQLGQREQIASLLDA